MIVAPALGAGDVRASVQLEPDDGKIEIGLQEKPFRMGAWRIVTDAPAADVVMGSPVVSDVVSLVS